MGLFKKITGQNHLPGTNDNGLRVYSKQFNELVDDLEKIDGLSNIQPKFVTVETSHLIDATSLFTALTADPFDVNDWKASFTVSFNEPFTLNGVYETSGDFSTENSYYNLIGLSPSETTPLKESVFQAVYFTPTGAPLLGALGVSNNLKIGAPGFNAEWTYTYEEDASATGSDPKYLHDFRITIDSTQILGYVVINADDSESHNFIIDSAAG